MRAKLIIAAVALSWLSLAATGQADPTIARAQESLKEQGFYYGEVTGTKDADTTAAIRRFQIRNGLKVTGDLNAETSKVLGIGSSRSPARSTPPRSTPRPEPEPVDEDEPMDTSDLRDDSPLVDRSPYEDEDDEFDGYGGPGRSAVNVFYGTPYETAPPGVQQQIVADAQMRLARGGYYRSGVDGIYGPGTEFALRAYQTRMGLAPTGRLDMPTLGSLGLLPRQRPGFVPRRRIIGRPQVVPGPDGEPIYIPR